MKTETVMIIKTSFNNKGCHIQRIARIKILKYKKFALTYLCVINSLFLATNLLWH